MTTRHLTTLLRSGLGAGFLLVSSASAQFVLTGTSYVQNFDDIGTALPADWSVRTGAIATGLGTDAAWNTAATAWGDFAGRFKNFASSANLAEAASNGDQSAEANRVLGVRQTGGFGDPGASFNFNFNTTGKVLTDLSLDLLMLSVQARSTAWTIQYGLGASPASFSDLATFNDPGAFGSTTLSFDSAQLAALNNQANVWFRVVALSGSTGGGSRDSFGIDNFTLAFTAAAGGPVSIGGGLVFSANSFGGAAFTADDTAVFDGTADTVTLSGEVVAGGLSFVEDGYTLSSPTGTDTIAVSGAVEVLADVTATISGLMTGSSGLLKSGEGTLVLTNEANDFVGNVTLNSGVLSVGADGVLGDAGNNLAFGGGVLAATDSFALGAGRDLSGSGALSVGAGDTLTVNGNVGMGTLSLADVGTVALAGGSNVVTTLALNAAGTLSGGTLTVNSLSTGAYAGTGLVSNDLDFGSAADRFIALNGDLELSGAVTLGGTNRRLIKTGEGTLVLSGDQSGNLGGIRLGVQGATPSEGGTLVVNANNALGATTLQFNSGTLSSETARTFANVISLGGRDNGVSAPTFAGADMVFTGDGNSFFRGFGTEGELVLNVNNQTTFTGTWNATGGSGTATGITVGGAGTLVLAGDASALTETVTLADTVTLTLNSTFGGAVNVASGTALSGTGTATGLVSVLAGGTLAPGNSIGTFNAAGGLTVDRGATMSFELDADGVTSDQVVTTNLLLGGGSGAVVFDFQDTGVVTSSYTLITFTFSDFSLMDLSYVNLAAGLVGGFVLGADSLGFEISIIPEPSAYAVLVGLMGLGLALGRRRRG